MRRILQMAACACLFCCASLIGTAQDLKALEISSEMEDSGKALITFRFTPGKSQDIKQLVIDCQYHQEFPFEESTGKRYTKIHEPVSFKYTSSNVKFVDELDKEVVFRIPMKMDLLKQIHGDKMFNDAYPVTISRFTITAIGEERKTLFEYKMTEGRYKWDDKSRKLEAVK